jgi:hypothetical protein
VREIDVAASLHEDVRRLHTPRRVDRRSALRGHGQGVLIVALDAQARTTVELKARYRRGAHFELDGCAGAQQLVVDVSAIHRQRGHGSMRAARRHAGRLTLDVADRRRYSESQRPAAIPGDLPGDQLRRAAVAGARHLVGAAQAAGAGQRSRERDQTKGACSHDSAPE